MTLQEFLRMVRRAQEPHVIVDSEGEPDCVILPYARYRALMERPHTPSLTERAVATVREAGDQRGIHPPEHGERYWDAMMEEVDPEPQFRFEPVDEGETP